MAPAVIAARSGADDNVFLDMTRAGFDLSDRGVTGRPAPGPVDILAWTERGIYRPGETVHAAALARDTNADAISGLPLTFLFSRPDGVEFRRMAVTSETLGGYAVDLPILPAKNSPAKAGMPVPSRRAARLSTANGWVDFMGWDS